MKRRSRTNRRSGTGIRLCVRDEGLLRALARFRLARTSDLTALCFPGVRADTAACRLRKLFDSSYLEVFAGDRSEENMYALGPRGREWAESLGLSSPAPPHGGREHHLAIVRTWVGFVRTAREVPGASLRLFRPDWEIREAIPGRSLGIVPDGLLELDTPERPEPVRLALEVDMGTEPLTTLRQKFLAYEQVHRSSAGLFGWEDFTLGVALFRATADRHLGVHKALKSTWSGGWQVWDGQQGADEAFQQLIAERCAPLTPPLTGPLAVRGGGGS